jgi:hypothetical protein
VVSADLGLRTPLARWRTAPYALLLGLAAASGGARADEPYAWPHRSAPEQTLAARIPAPSGFTRVAAEPGSFAAWLRGLPLKPGRPAVRLYDGAPKRNQEAHWAIVDIDVGRRDLQQCADAVMRLRAEYLYASGRAQEVAFDFTSGDRAAFARWAEGARPVVTRSRVSWSRSAAADRSYDSFRRYLDVVFTYAGSASLAKELKAVARVRDIAPGDVFIQGGSPGHAVIVVDVAEKGKDRMFLLAQSYMPAQEVHVLKNPAREGDPWYEVDFGETLVTPEWTFRKGDLKRF